MYLAAFFVMLIPVIHLSLIAVPIVRRDVAELRIPNALVVPNILLSLVCLSISALLGEYWYALGSFSVSLVCFVFLVWLSLRGVFGMGDAKLFTAMSLCVGWFSINGIVAMLVGNILLVALIGLLAYTKRLHLRRHALPLAPIMFSVFPVVAVLSVASII